MTSKPISQCSAPISTHFRLIVVSFEAILLFIVCFCIASLKNLSVSLISWWIVATRKKDENNGGGCQFHLRIFTKVFADLLTRVLEPIISLEKVPIFKC
jgi:hypothetical protein